MGVYDYIKPTKSSSKVARDFYTVTQPLDVDSGAATEDMLTTQITVQDYPTVSCPGNNTYDSIISVYNSNQYANSVAALMEGLTNDQQVAVAMSVVTYSGYILPTYVPLGLRTENTINRSTEMLGIDYWWETGVQRS